MPSGYVSDYSAYISNKTSEDPISDYGTYSTESNVWVLAMVFQNWQWLQAMIHDSNPTSISSTIFIQIGNQNMHFELLYNRKRTTPASTLVPPISVPVFHLGCWLHILLLLLRISCQKIHCFLQATVLIIPLGLHETRFRIWEYLFIPFLDDVEHALLPLLQAGFKNCQVIFVVAEISNASAWPYLLKGIICGKTPTSLRMGVRSAET